MADTISVLDGSTFVVSDRGGDVNSSKMATHGLFHEDTRYLSTFSLTIDGQTPTVLSTDDVAYHSAQFFLVQPTASVMDDASVSIIRKRTISRGFTDSLTILNHSPEPASFQIRFDIAADFADLFEIKEDLRKLGDLHTRVTKDALVLGYRRQSFVRETEITASRDDGIFSDDGLSFAVEIEPLGEWLGDIHVRIAVDIRSALRATGRRRVSAKTDADRQNDLAEWFKQAPKVRSDWSTIEEIYKQSLTDLAALRLPGYLGSDDVLPAAGLPWFMCMFGRDSIITSYQTLPFLPDFARSTLRVLALLQAQTIDHFRDAEPGKIMHELRNGELTVFAQRPHSPYYGTADATPLFLVLLDEYERWTGDEALVHDLEDEARAALDWIDNYGDADGDGYIEYERRNTETGLENQCWKDSPSSIVFADGSPGSLPRVTCELQGYVYDAKRRMARLARNFWADDALAVRLEAEAAELKRRFNTDYWMPQRQCFALALDGDKRQVDSVTSNIGHLLWSGIVDDDKAEACAGHLLDSALFSGWGIRTMASTEAGYSPVGYHTGTVWPHDNSLAAHGLARYGYRDEAALVALALLQAGEFFRHRLPEAFAGYSRDRTRYPVEFPTACSPQAWSAGAPLLMLRTLLGLEPTGFLLHTDPVLPADVGYVDIIGVRGRWGRTNVFSIGATVAHSTTPEPGSIGEVFASIPDHVNSARLGSIGSLRVDLVDGDSWHFSVVDDRVQVKQSTQQADCVIRAQAVDIIDIYDGTKTPSIAAMQGRIQITGDLNLSLTWGSLLAAAGEHARRARSHPDPSR